MKTNPPSKSWKAGLRRVIMLACLAGAAGAALACAETPGPTCGAGAASPASQPLGLAVNVGAGNPINVVNGNKYQREDDMPALPGVMGLEIVRHYNSSLGGPDAWTGRVGRGWRLSYETRLVVAAGSIDVLQADGGSVTFVRDALKPSVATTDNPARGVITVKRAGRGNEYLWRWADGRELSFNTQGQLVQIRAATGETTSLMYDPRGPLVRVTDPQGRSLRLNYLDRDSAARGERFRGVQSIDTPVGRFSYEYGSILPKGSGADKGAVLANLVRVRYPEAGQGRQYHYEDAPHPTFLTGISIEGLGADGRAQSQRYATFGYNAGGKGILSTHAGGVDKVTLDFERPGVTAITNSLGQKTTYRYAGSAGDFRLIEVRGAGCALCGVANERYSYDALGRLTETTKLDASGSPTQTMHTEVDRYGRPLRVSVTGYSNGKRGAAQLQARYEYGAGLQSMPSLTARPSVVPGKEALLETVYNALGQPVRITESGWTPPAVRGEAPVAIKRVTTYDYKLINGRSLLVKVDGPLPNGPGATPADSDITLYEYDAAGFQVERTVAPGNLVTEVKARDVALRPALVRNSDGARQIESRMTYAHDGGLLSVKQRASLPGGGQPVLERSTVFYYDAARRLAAVGSPGEPLMRTVYDAAGRVEAYIDPKGNKIAQHKDGEGKRIALIALDRDGKTLGGLLNLWDDQNRLRARLHPGGVTTATGFSTRTGETVELDGNGDASAATSRGGNLHILAADDSSRRLWTAPGALVIADGANRLHGIFKDDFGRTVLESAPDEGVLRFAYQDGAIEKGHTGKDGRLTTTERMEFLPDGRLQRRVRDGCTETFRYEGNLLAGLEGCGNRQAYWRDAFGQLLRQEQTVERKGAAALVFRTGYVYDDKTGRLAERVLPDGQRLRYRYDAADGSAVGIDRDSGWLAWTERSVGVGVARMLRGALPRGLTSEALIAEVVWRPFGGMASVSAGNGVSTGMTYDTSGRVTALRVADGTGAAIEQVGYRYDGAGNLVERSRNAEARRYHYDAMRRLRAERGDAPALRQVAYGYDALGTRVMDQEAPEYDAFGRQHGNGRQTFVYNRASQLVSVAEAGREVASYRYDALGNRIAKTVRGETTYFVYDAAHQLVAEADQQGNWTRQYLYIDGRPVVLMQAEGAAQTRDVYAIHADQRGLPLAVTDARRQVVWRQDFDAFGNVLRSPLQRTGLHGGEALEMNLRMAGQYEDAETGLYYNINRYYDPRQGRYITPDPLGLAGGENSYAYVHGNPLAGTDPLGLFHIPGPFFTGNDPLNDKWGLDKDGGHGDIVRLAFSQYLRSGGNQGRFSQHFIEWVIRNNYHADVNGSLSCFPVGWTNGGGQCNPRNHFDNPNDGPLYENDNKTKTSSYKDGLHDDWIKESLDQLNANRMSYQNLTFAPDNGANVSRILSAFGQNAHALADFYAHTNWVDANTRGGCVTNKSVVPYAIETGFVPVGLDQTTVWTEVSKPDLYSGTVAGANRFCSVPLYGDIDCADKTTHGYWNKDGEDTDAGRQPYTGKDIRGWRVDAYDPDSTVPSKNPGDGYGKIWYSDTASTASGVKKGDLIYSSYKVSIKHEVAFYDAIEHTKLEIARLFDGAAGISASGQSLRDIFKMDKNEMKKNHIVYSDKIGKD